MNGRVLNLLTSGAPAWAVALFVVLAALTLLIGSVARLIRAAHPGRSADAVKMHKNRLEHLRWKAERRDRRRRERAAHRAMRRAALQARRIARTDAEIKPRHTATERDADEHNGGV
ncbi:hypothetical protein ABZ464_24855 [Streptomyces sp. NPDC005820]|uniref:hypothetical protein n=1 Tax=Streptomyces sp. NPDC005820 TaxID=3157069 RepID=UPI0033F6DC63